MVCSDCFNDEGLRLSAFQMGIDDGLACDKCGSASGRKLDKSQLLSLAHRFFVWGTLHKCEYGAAPQVQFNQHQKTSINVSEWLKHDVKLFESYLGIGFFHYGPRFWMIGEVEPLKELQSNETRNNVIDRILTEYPAIEISEEVSFYRIRNNPQRPHESYEYDSPPIQYSGVGRLDSDDLSIMYGSPDLQVCLHECRVSAEDEIYVATLQPKQKLKLLNLTEILEEDCTEFESLDMAVHMLFLAGKHSYGISRDISKAAVDAGYDGIVFPSYFSLLRTGGMPFETTYGLSHRRIPQLQEYEADKIIQNIALFGHPINENKVVVKCINKLILQRVEYSLHFGPVEQ